MSSAPHTNAEASSSRVTLDHLRTPKVNQVDAEELDEGLAQMLGERVERSLSNFRVGPASLPLTIHSKLVEANDCAGLIAEHDKPRCQARA
jgi:hypothetical protein